MKKDTLTTVIYLVCVVVIILALIAFFSGNDSLGIGNGLLVGGFAFVVALVLFIGNKYGV